jgi:peptidoglycan/xylan/chitin deacetylase (PgdA/CDA1 family)
MQFPVNLVKQPLKRGAGMLAAGLSFITRRTADDRQACIFCYHRVAPREVSDAFLDDWNVPPDAFKCHIATLAKQAECVRLQDLPDRLRSSRPVQKPLACVTFDDGYSGVYTYALPVLKHFGVPATLFLPARWIGSTEPFPFDRWGRKFARRVSADAWRPLSLAQIRECIESGLISIGSHSMDHRDASRATAFELRHEAEASRRLLENLLPGHVVDAYAYPYGSQRLGQVPTEYVEFVRAAGYRIAVTTELGLARATNDPLRLPRVEANGSDGESVMRAKLAGSLLPYMITDALRIPRRGHHAG